MDAENLAAASAHGPHRSWRTGMGATHAAALLGAAYVALAVIGIVREYAPVPYQDRWSLVHFYAHLAQHGWREWWAQHNEHRIVLQRIGESLDCGLFACRGASLLALDVALISLVALLLYRLASSLLRGSRAFERRDVVALLIVVACFSWTQHQNLTQAFQLTFVSAYALPMAAFAALARSAAETTCGGRWFASSLALGVLSVATMANGVATLPLMVAMALALRQPTWRVALLAALAVGVATAYFTGYGLPPHHGDVVATLRTRPLASIGFALALLGGPLGVATGSTALAMCAGATVVLTAVAAWLRWRREPSPAALALVAFVVYASASALATSGGRLVFGVDYALSSRYLTPALYAWAAAMILAVWLLRERRSLLRALGVAGGLAAVAFFVAQLPALGPEPKRVREERMLAALALELGLRDEPLAHTVFPNDDVFAYAEEARSRRLAPFDGPPLEGLRETLGRRADDVGAKPCRARIDAAIAVDGEPGVLRLIGNVRAPVPPPRVYVLARDDRVIGAGIGFTPRVDWRRRVGLQGADTAFNAYVRADDATSLRFGCPGP